MTESERAAIWGVVTCCVCVGATQAASLPLWASWLAFVGGYVLGCWMGHRRHKELRRRQALWSHLERIR